MQGDFQQVKEEQAGEEVGLEEEAEQGGEAELLLCPEVGSLCMTQKNGVMNSRCAQ